ncbi:MAG TPA: DUF3300 domain-containing protein [Phycisphaerales bacterium]|nr:DUF3300 domain-containing protein [Phycisphaerales bacterium]
MLLRTNLICSLSSSLLLVISPALAQDFTPESERTVPEVPAPGDKLSDADLEELLAPIALYPDTLLANVLAAAVYPDEIQRAAQFVEENPNATPDEIELQEFEPPVKAIAEVSTVIKMLVKYPDWTAAIGQAYLLQAADVMDAVQRLRAKAKANGALESTPQQVVVQDGSTIMIEPPTPDVVYVPVYDPDVVYVTSYVPRTVFVGFSVGFAVRPVFHGVFCDWHHHWIGWGWRRPHWGPDHRFDHWHHPRPGDEFRPWRPNVAKVRPSRLWHEGGAREFHRFRGAETGRFNNDIPGRRPGSRVSGPSNLTPTPQRPDRGPRQSDPNDWRPGPSRPDRPNNPPPSTRPTLPSGPPPVKNPAAPSTGRPIPPSTSTPKNPMAPSPMPTTPRTGPSSPPASVPPAARPTSPPSSAPRNVSPPAGSPPPSKNPMTSPPARGPASPSGPSKNPMSPSARAPSAKPPSGFAPDRGSPGAGNRGADSRGGGGRRP